MGKSIFDLARCFFCQREEVAYFFFSPFSLSCLVEHPNPQERIGDTGIVASLVYRPSYIGRRSQTEERCTVYTQEQKEKKCHFYAIKAKEKEASFSFIASSPSTFLPWAQLSGKAR